MILQIVVENGVKKIKKLTADTGAGLPVGTIIGMYKKSSPSGYLYLDGSTFDQNAYPLLYAYLGSNVLPDYREFALVGAEQNTTDTIADHDVYTEGQAKDDQLQSHKHSVNANKANVYASGNENNGYFYSSSPDTETSEPTNARAGTVTRGKRKAVYWYIKATSGLSENAQDNVINTLNEQRSYSTEEHLTGKKWIDGKPIYSKVIEHNFGAGQTVITHNIGISRYIDVRVFVGSPVQYANSYLSSQYNISIYDLNVNTFGVMCNSWTGSGYIILEYTKTTD